MNKRIFGADLLLLLTAAVWGFGFVAQRTGMQYIGPFTFNGIRFLLGSLSLLPLLAWKRSQTRRTGIAARNAVSHVQDADTAAPAFSSFRTGAFYPSLLAGTCLFMGVTLQQLGMMFTTAGNAGFITGLYVVLTPIFGIFLGRKTGPATWVGAILTLTGLYFLSSGGSSEGVNPGDIIVAVSAVFWAFHVLIIDRLVKKTDPLTLSSGQFAFAGLFALAAAFLVEPFLSHWLTTRGDLTGLIEWRSFPALITGLKSGSIPVSFIANAMVPILYGGLAAVGIGYTLQVVAQQHAPPAHATIILCLEGCFAALGGVIILGEQMSVWIIIGFSLMLAGMLASQWELIAGGRDSVAPD